MIDSDSSPLPPKIGPYRLDERLGQGGMGEVYRGYDARLDRPVALKRVRTDLGDPELARRRFQREARAAARLRHPAIVQVHDWVETEEGAWLVMELVEGRSLREILRRGVMQPERVVGLAHDLLEGLAAAHEKGLVHRDLKAENVMVSPAGSSGRGRLEQARILDFGLAKNAVPTADETRVSLEGKIVGTLSAMAPEQVLGQSLDGRTDLFALGCLLYEALTGAQPFTGSSAGETVNRICTARQTPVCDLQPKVPKTLSDFIDRLLEKDPRRRPASAAAALEQLDRLGVEEGFATGAGLDFETRGAGGTIDGETLETPGQGVAEAPAPEAGGARIGPARPGRHLGGLAALALILALALAALYFFPRGVGEKEPRYVAVPETQLLGGSDGTDLELAAGAIHTAIFRGLVDFTDVVPLEVPPDAVKTEDPRLLTRVTAADEVLSSRLECRQGGCRVVLRRLGADGRVVWAHDFAVRPERFLELSRAVLSFLPRAFEGERRRRGAFDLEVQPDDFETFLKLVRRFEKRAQGFDVEQLITELERLAGASPRFVSVPILEAHVHLQQFEQLGQDQSLERARRAVRRARDLAPQDPQVLMLAARAERLSGDLDAAGEILDLVRQLEPGNVEAQFAAARLLERKGEADRAIELALAAADQLPMPPLLFNTGSLLYRHGRFEEARTQIERGLGLDPESFAGLSLLAQLELTQGDMERAAVLYRRLVERTPEIIEINNLGTALMMLGRYDEAAEQFRRITNLDPDSPVAALNLADVEKLAGRDEQAEALYKWVIELVEADPQPERLASVKAQALAHLGRAEAAVEAIQETVRQQPDHPWTAYEAALVHALNGERASALWNIRRALAQGLEPRWFDLPWFDSLREAIDAELDTDGGGGET